MEAYVDFYFILITIIFNNLLAGIIIDSFAEHRTNDNEMNTDINTICYICGTQKHIIDRTSVNFKYHVEV